MATRIVTTIIRYRRKHLVQQLSQFTTYIFTCTYTPQYFASDAVLSVPPLDLGTSLPDAVLSVPPLDLGTSLPDAVLLVFPVAVKILSTRYFFLLS